MESSNVDDDEPWLDTRPDAPIKPRVEQPLWVVHMSHHKIAAARGLVEGFICVGWVEAGDLTRYPGQQQLKAAFDKHYPGQPPGRLANWAGDARRFVFEMNKGDLFVFPVTGKDEIHIGEVIDDYRFLESDADLVAGDSASVRNVRWLGTVRRSAFTKAALLCFDSEHTVHCGTSYRSEVTSLLAQIAQS